MSTPSTVPHVSTVVSTVDHGGDVRAMEVVGRKREKKRRKQGVRGSTREQRRSNYQFNKKADESHLKTNKESAKATKAIKNGGKVLRPMRRTTLRKQKFGFKGL
jgi:hypothetical protein